MKKPHLLCILDGWGIAPDNAFNAITQANTPVFDNIWANCPHTTLRADGLNVGLPEGQFGNSEVGHLNIGAGRIVMQDLPRINLATADGSLAQNPLLQNIAQHTGEVHLLGLVSDGGVHAHANHIIALAKGLSAFGAKKVWVHVITDGRDTAPQAALQQLPAFLDELANVPNVAVATVSGRYYAMDRDNRWERVQLAFNAMVHGQGQTAATPMAALQAAYDAGLNDEFVLPTVIANYQGVGQNAGWVMANFRSDRVRQILRSLWLPAFAEFERGTYTAPTHNVGMVVYADDLLPHHDVLFAQQQLTHILNETLAAHGCTQLHAAETEKYPHVTFFFNGGEEKREIGENWLLVPSPKVATYDLAPQMSAIELATQVAAKIEDGIYDVVIVNFANPDMVGHTGDMAATVQAVETTDYALGMLLSAVQKLQGVAIVIADHGNADKMWDDATNQPHTAHTTAPVPCVVVGTDNITLKNGGVLGNVAPTLLDLMGLPKPDDMTCDSLVERL